MTKTTQALAITPKRFEAFLTSLVNLQWEELDPVLDDRDLSRFKQKFAEEFGLYDPRFLGAFLGENATREDALNKPSPLIPTRTRFETRALRFLYLLFRAAWVEPDARTREWAWVYLRARLNRSLYSSEPLPWKWTNAGAVLSSPPAELPVERAFSYLIKHHGRTRSCPNPECPSRYFFSKRHTQRYCSESCAQNAEREIKRRWWSEHGTDWRNAQKGTQATGKTTKKRKKVN